MVLPRRVRSPNKRGGHWAEYGERQAWRKLLLSADVTTDNSIALPVVGRMRLEITRLAPTKRYILDVDNMAASVKRLLDTLVECGFLLDDDRESIDGPYLSQKISQDACYWTIVKITEAAEQQAPKVEVVSPKDFSRLRLHSVRTRCA
jgi:hypothetical protein